MTAVVEMASIPPWRQLKRRTEENEQAGGSLGSVDPMSGRKRDFLSKKQISENTFFYSRSGQSSTRDLNRNDARSVGKSVHARPSDKDVEILANLDSPEWNLTTGEKTEGGGRVSVNNMVSQTRQSEVNANGPTPSTFVNGALVDEERIGSVHDNPFVKTFGIKHVVKPASYSESVSSETYVNSAASGNRLNSSESDMPEKEEDYRPGSGFVHKILDKFALLTAREEALHPGLNHYLRKRSSSLENLVDNDSEKTTQRVSVGDEVFTTSPKSNLQYYSKAKSVENLTRKTIADRSVSEDFDSRRRDGHGRHRSTSEQRRSHPAPDANLAREDIIIIDTTPSPCSPRPLDEDPLKQPLRRRRTSSSERHLEQNELPKPNTVSSYRKKFESARSDKNDVVKPRKKNRAPAAPTTTTDTNHTTTNGSKHKDTDNLPDVIKENGGDSSRDSHDSSFDTQNDSSLDVNYVEKDYENPVYDAIRASLRHVKLTKEEEITYSWRRNNDPDPFEGKPNYVISNNVNNTSSSHGINVSNQLPHKDVNTVSIKPASPTASTISMNSTSKVQNKPAVKESQTKINNTQHAQQQQKSENLGQQKPTATVRKSLNAAPAETKTTPSTSVVNVPSRTDKIETNMTNDNTVSTDLKEVTTSVTVSTKTSTNSSSGNTKGPAPKPPVVKATEPVVKATEPVVRATQPALSKPKLMVNVGPKDSSDSVGPSYRSSNRFAPDEKEEQSYVHAGKTWFYQAGKFKANPEGVKRPNNSPNQDHVPKKRTSPAPTNVTVLNLTDDATDGSVHVTPRSNIDDYINGSIQDIPITVLDEPLNLGRGAPGSAVVPPLDLTPITKPVPSQRSSSAQKKIQKCNYHFTGGNVVIGNGLLQTKKKAQKFKLHFDDSLNSTYEYPSEELMLEEYLTEHPDEKELVLTFSDYIADTDESSDDIEDVGSPKEEQRNTLMSTPGVGNQSSGLSSYRSKNQIDYQFGMEFELQAKKERDQLRKEQSQQEIVTEDGDLIPADDDDLSGFSATSTTSDILF